MAAAVWLAIALTVAAIPAITFVTEFISIEVWRLLEAPER